MNEQIDDSKVITIIISTIIIVFLLIFTFVPSRDKLSPPIQWKDSPSLNVNKTINYDT
ncbi:hypothetical protein [Prochlorococcus sp. MIT 0603]|uniref:hypothetical protein n=1 Tax=unclassified Prochlorococcus TaxID=2627481 RepID=UPI000533732F|nr:hypothetical protein EV07_0762 [Prochlorococcus sp. MIT 0603]